MEGTEGEFKDNARMLQIASHCAKAAFQLSSLKSTFHDEPEKGKMMRDRENLRVALVKERLKIKKTKLCGSMELILQVIFVILFSCFFIKLAFDSFVDDESSLY